MATNVEVKAPIPIFYWGTDLDSFLAAHAVRSFIAPTARVQITPLKDGDVIGSLENAYPIFVGVKFKRLHAIPDCSRSVNCVIIARYEHSEVFLEHPELLPNRQHMDPAMRKKLRNNVMSKMMMCDFSSFTRMGYESMSTRARMLEIIPGFVKHMVDIFEKPEPSREEELIVLGASKDRFFAENNYALFETKYIKPWTNNNQVGVIQELVAAGEASIADADKALYAMVERNSTFAEFAGYKVKIAHLPSEYADKAGELMAKHQPFAVVYEDIPVQNKRVYRLYSHRGGLNVMEVAQNYKPEGNPRQATFSVNIDFSNYRYL